MKTKPYLVVYDVEGDVFLAKTQLTKLQVEAAKSLSSVYHVLPLPLDIDELVDMSADDVLELRSEFDDDFDSDFELDEDLDEDEELADIDEDDLVDGEE